MKGAGFETTYVYLDTVPYEGGWWYWLADVDTQGREAIRARANLVVQPDVEWPYRLYLPVVLKESP